MHTVFWRGKSATKNLTKYLGYRQHEPGSELQSTPEAHRTSNVTCSAAVKLDTKITRQMHSDSSKDEMLNKYAKYTLFDKK
jgi:hypothetical protein